MGCAMFLRGCCVDFISKTQGLLALSCSEAERYAIGYGAMETIVVRSCVREVSIAPIATITSFADSYVGKPMTTRRGASSLACSTPYSSPASVTR